MAKSLQDQLLQTGLSDEKQARKIRKDKHKARKQSKPSDTSETETSRARVQQAKEEKAARDREINRERQREAERNARLAQVRQLLTDHAVDRARGDTPYNFVVNKKVHKLHLPTELCDRLARGQLAIAVHNDDFYIIPAETADKIRERDSDTFIVQHTPQRAGDDGDDPYADYPIPDDLMW
jgi:hypothetical protein